jgi:hypothetical protein
MDRWNPKNGTFTVGGHGTACGNGMTDSQGNRLTPNRLAELIRASPNYTKGQPISLYMCNTGGACPTGFNFAQRLANEMGVGVRAPDGFFNLAFRESESTARAWTSKERNGDPDKVLNMKWHEPNKNANTKKCDK